MTRFTAFLLVSCLVLAGLVVALAWENQRLESELAGAAAGPRELPAGALAEGDPVGRLVRDKGAGSPDLAADGPTLLMVFSEECAACDEVMPAWVELAGTVREPGRALGLRLGGKEPGVPFSSPPFPVHDLESYDESVVQRIPYVPATFLVGPDGIVELAFYGVLAPRQQRALRVRLLR